MKKAFVYCLLAVLALTGCQAELEAPIDELEILTQKSAKVFTATIDDDFSGDTKTSLDGEGNVLWKQGDQVSIFAGSTVNEQYQVTDASEGKTAASLNKVGSGGFVAGTEIDNNVAFYPYASTAEIEKSGGSYIISGIELPSTQNYAEGSFGNGAFPMTAVTSSTEDMNLKFKNVLGGLKLQLKGTATITSITVTGNNNELLCGDAEVTVAYGGTPSISLTDAAAKTVTLDCGSGVALNTETATPFIVALPPIIMTGGFTVLVTDTEGKQMEISTSKSQTIIRSSLLKMPVVNYVGAVPESVDYLAEPFTITSTGSTSVSLLKEGSPAGITLLEYRKGTDSWAAYTIGTAVDLSNGEYIQFRAGEGGNESFSTSSSSYYYINVSGEGTVNLSGNIMSLLDRSLLKASVPQHAFDRLFYNESKIVDASNLKLPATTLAASCYYDMFYGCTSLTTAPAILPATKLASSCYGGMFYGCTSLTTAPAILPATKLASHCYECMFYYCTSLTTAPELPATKLASSCYEYMFSGCTSLTTAPELPATTLAESCYYGMFRGCTSLTTAPALPTTTLAQSCYGSMFSDCKTLTTAPQRTATALASQCYSYMFKGCTNLTTAPELPATTLAYGCYGDMFSGCTSLTKAPELPATTLALASDCYRGMFYYCTSLTTAPALPATTLEWNCYDSMFEGCTSLTTAPALPATTLAFKCYYQMFYYCTSLTKAPELPATTLADYCYSYMFYSCTSLNYIKMLATDISVPSCLRNWVSGVAATGTFVKSKDATWDVTGINGVPSGWTIVTE